MNYMVAYDFSVDAANALAAALEIMNKKTDFLIIATVAEHLGKKYGLFGKVEQIKEAQTQYESEVKSKLNSVIDSVHSKGVPIFL